MFLSLIVILLSVAHAAAAPVPSSTETAPAAASSTGHAADEPLSDHSVNTYAIVACSVAGGLLVVLGLAIAFVYRYYHPQHLRERAPPQPRTHLGQSASIDSTDKGSVRSLLTEPMGAVVERGCKAGAGELTADHDGLASIDETAAPPPKARRVLGINGWAP